MNHKLTLPNLTTEKIIEIKEIYEKQTCNITQTCKAIGIARITWYAWIRQCPEFAQAMEEADDGLIDIAESQLYKNILLGKETSLIYFLKNKRPKEWNERRFEEPRVNINISLESLASAWEKMFNFKGVNQQQLVSIN